jgi:hypothetical protein
MKVLDFNELYLCYVKHELRPTNKNQNAIRLIKFE